MADVTELKETILEKMELTLSGITNVSNPKYDQHCAEATKALAESYLMVSAFTDEVIVDEGNVIQLISTEEE